MHALTRSSTVMATLLLRRSAIAPRHLLRPAHRAALPSASARTLTTRATQHTLNTGAKIPALGFGTFQDPDAQVDGVCRALRAGMRLIDTARVYDVERQVGRGIKNSGIPRGEIFLATKLWCNKFHPDDVEAALEESLADLDTPYVDLLMMHYPCTFRRGDDRFPRDGGGRMLHGETTYVDTWKAMERLPQTGKVRALGVSNFSRGEMQKLLDECTVVSRQPLAGGIRGAWC